MERLYAEYGWLARDLSKRGNVIVIRRTWFLERSVWLAVTDTVRQFNGRWINAGKDSRWEIHLDRTENLPLSTSSDALEPLA